MSKYGNIKKEVDGYLFDSIHEANRYQELMLMVKSGDIKQLELQPKFNLIVKTGKSVGVYKADFKYYDNVRKQWVIEDAKSAGTRTTVYRLKKRIVEEVYKIKIEEV